MFRLEEILKIYDLKNLIKYEISKIYIALSFLISALVYFIYMFIKWLFGKEFSNINDRGDYCTDNNTLPQIHYAAKRCMDDPKYIDRCIKLLKNHPSAVNEKYYGYTPFLRACKANCKELITFMLKLGADIEILTINGDSPVYLVVHAICTGNIKDFDSLKILVDAGCSVNCLVNNKYTALHIASFYGNNDLVQWLLLNGADPAPPNCLSPSLCAKNAGHLSTARLLDINIDDVSFDNTE